MPIISSPGGKGGGAISGVTVAGAAAAGDVPVASSASAGAWALPPGFEIGYDQITAAVPVASATEATGTTIISCAAHTFDGSPVLAHFFSSTVYWPSNASPAVTVSLFEGATQIGRLAQLFATITADQAGVAVSAFLRFTPTAGPHTFTVTAFVSSTNGTPSVNAGGGSTDASTPAFCRFTKV